MQQGTILELTLPLALEAARISLESNLPLADSVILATAQSCDAVLWTQDSDFQNMEGVRYVKKKG